MVCEYYAEEQKIELVTNWSKYDSFLRGFVQNRITYSPIWEHFVFLAELHTLGHPGQSSRFECVDIESLASASSAVRIFHLQIRLTDWQVELRW